MKGGMLSLLVLPLIIGCVFGTADGEKCEIISNHTINGIQYRECKDGRLMKVTELKSAEEDEGTLSNSEEDVNLSEVGVISGDEEFLKDIAKTSKKDSDATFDNHYGKQREIREKVHYIQETLKAKKKRSETATVKGRKFGVIYKHNGFDEGSVSHHEEDEESDEEIEDEEEAIGGKDALIKATVADLTTVTPTTVSSSLSLGEGINDTPKDVDVKELIALAHHKSYHKELKPLKPITPDSESLKDLHPETHQPHDTVHFGNLRFLDFAPEEKSPTDTPSAAEATTKEESDDLLLPETPNNSQQQQQPQLPPNPYFLALANNPIKITSVERSSSTQKDSENIFNDVRKVFASATPTSDFDRRHYVLDSTSSYYSMIRPQIILAFLAPVTAFLIYCAIVLFYIYRKKSSAQRKLLPTKNCRYQHFNEDAEATVGFAV